MKDTIKKAADVLRKGGIIIYPTDTIWGIGCDATNEQAVEKIYNIKKRADSKSMLVLADTINRVEQYVKQVPDIAYDLIEVSDKPLTIVYPGATGLADNLLADDGSIGMRVVQHEFCRLLIRELNRPIVSTSANVTGEKAPAKFGDIPKTILEQVDFVVDPRFEGKSSGKPSSIIKLGTGGQVEIIRP